MKKLLFFTFFLLSVVSLTAQQTAPRTIIKSIYFGGGSYWIDDEQILELFQMIDSIPNLDYYQIFITSHTDNIGGKEYNQWLSEKRSESVIEQLQTKIDRNRILKKDFGQNNPLYDNNTMSGRIMNRRVDIIFSPINL